MQADEIILLPARRPVQARSLRTRARLLDATIETLVEFGYAGAKTIMIAARAEVSQDALYRHFTSKLDLLGEALDRLLAWSRDQLKRGLAVDLEAETDLAGATFQHVWNVFSSKRLQAAFELYLAARTDHDLAQRIAPVIETPSIADHRAGARPVPRRRART